MTTAAELRDELLQGLDYYGHWERESAHQEEVERQRFIRSEVEQDGYAELGWNGTMIELGKLVATQHMHGWLELHVLPKLDVLERMEELEAEAERWRSAHKSVVKAKRELSMRYGAIMRRKPRARLRRLHKRVKHYVTKITQKPVGMR